MRKENFYKKTDSIGEYMRLVRSDLVGKKSDEMYSRAPPADTM